MSGAPVTADKVIEVLRHACLQLERTPGFVETTGEEGLRDALLVALNGALIGQAFGETYNRRGKTDILVRSGGLNVFIAECKLYGGPAGLRKAIDQLLGYTGWRERRIGLIVFVRSTTMTTAIKAAREVLKGISAVQKVEAVDGNDSELSVLAIHPEDPDVTLELSVQLVNLPGPSKRGDLAGGDVADREKTLEEVLAAQGVPGSDAELAYQSHATPPGLDLPHHPRSLVRLEKITSEGRSAVDAIPLSPEAARKHAPAGKLEFEDSEAADQALRRAMHAVQGNGRPPRQGGPEVRDRQGCAAWALAVPATNQHRPWRARGADGIRPDRPPRGE
jgi:hypothetical protein